MKILDKKANSASSVVAQSYQTGFAPYNGHYLHPEDPRLMYKGGQVRGKFVPREPVDGPSRPPVTRVLMSYLDMSATALGFRSVPGMGMRELYRSPDAGHCLQSLTHLPGPLLSSPCQHTSSPLCQNTLLVPPLSPILLPRP